MAAYTNFIAAIDLGTSHIIGMVGEKSPSGILSIVAEEKEISEGCIKRGYIYNVEETAMRVKRLIRKLETKLQGTKIEQVYVGIGGQSLHTIDYTVSKILGGKGTVSEEVLSELEQDAHEYRPDTLDVLSVVSPTYMLDGNIEFDPLGHTCNRLEAIYKLVVGRPSLRLNLMKAIEEKCKIKIAGMFISPLVQADVLLSGEDKKLGCALVCFGAGVTSLAVYKNGKLINLIVIPLGCNLITRDIMSLELNDSEAERIKRNCASARADKKNKTSIQVNFLNGEGKLSLSKLDIVVEARMKEILENVYARLKDVAVADSLEAGIIICGGGAYLKYLPEVMQNRFGMNVRYAEICNGIVEEESLSFVRNPENTVVIGLLNSGTENCAFEEKEPEEEKKEPVKVVNTPVNENPQITKDKKKGIIRRGFDSIMNNIFEDE